MYLNIQMYPPPSPPSHLIPSPPHVWIKLLFNINRRNLINTKTNASNLSVISRRSLALRVPATSGFRDGIIQINGRIPVDVVSPGYKHLRAEEVNRRSVQEIYPKLKHYLKAINTRQEKLHHHEPDTIMTNWSQTSTDFHWRSYHL